MKNAFCFGMSLILGVSLLFSNSANAGIMAEKTRVIFPEGANEKSLMIANTNKYPILVQTWIDDGDVNNTPEKTDAALVVLPAVFKMEPGEAKGLRILFKKQSMPSDRESLFWLNLYEIPPKVKSNSTDQAELLVAMNMQMKIFYRPKALLTKDINISDSLKFTIEKKGMDFILNCSNPTGYYASFSSLKLLIDGKEYKSEIKLDMMVPPKSEEQFIFKHINPIKKDEKIHLEYMLIDDDGISQLGERHLLL